MGYSQQLEVNKDFTAEEFEDIRADITKLVNVAMGAGIDLCGYKDNQSVLIGSDLIVFNGVGKQSSEPFVLTREIDYSVQYKPTLTFCKTNRRNYDAVVAAALMVIKQRVPYDVIVTSDGRWGYEWLHGVGCYGGRKKAETCDNHSGEHMLMSGRSLYKMAFPDSPEPRYTFESPLVSKRIADRYFYVARDAECVTIGSSFKGLPFGVTLKTLVAQSVLLNSAVCMVCGEDTITTIRTTKSTLDDWADGRPMCEFCYFGRLLGGKITGHTYSDAPFILIDVSTGKPITGSSRSVERRNYGSLTGFYICVTGKFSSMTHKEFHALIEANGGTVHASVRDSTDILVTGERVGDTKINKARQLGVWILTEAEFKNRYLATGPGFQLLYEGNRFADAMPIIQNMP